MTQRSLNKVTALSCLTASMLAVSPAHSDALIDAITSGNALADIRLRYETADDSVNDEADALIVRTRLGYQTGLLAGFSALVEMEDVRTVAGLDDYAPEQPGYSVIADPESTELNRGFLQYQYQDLTLAGGRQRIIYDNARFVGNVGWRQNEQTFDAFSAGYKLGAFGFSYAYLDKVNSITDAFDANVTDHLINLSFSGLSFGKLTGYGYLLEDDDTDATNDTMGVRFAGETAFESLKLIYALEFATQEADSGTEFDADYQLVELGAGLGPVTVKFGYELLGSDDGDYAFQTPLATKHAFNGWADKFLVTPAGGLEDLYVSVGTSIAGIGLLAVYHQFEADEGSGDYGDELDLQAVKSFGKHYSVGLKYAAYSANDDSIGAAANRDIDKFWVWGELKF